MLEPLFRCNLACAGCGKIDYPESILNRRMTVQECLDAAEECGAPDGRDPRRRAPDPQGDAARSLSGLVAQKRFVSLCTNALLLEKKLHLFEPSPYLFFSVHLDGLRDHHDKSVCQDGRFRPGVQGHSGRQGQGLRRQRQRDGLRRL